MNPPCQHCLGSGREVDHSLIGEMAKYRRHELGGSQSGVARKMGISGEYLCRLESGKRPWSLKLWQQFLKACRS